MTLLWLSKPLQHIFRSPQWKLLQFLIFFLRFYICIFRSIFSPPRKRRVMAQKKILQKLCKAEKLNTIWKSNYLLHKHTIWKLHGKLGHEIFIWRRNQFILAKKNTSLFFFKIRGLYWEKYLFDQKLCQFDYFLATYHKCSKYPNLTLIISKKLR